VTELHRPPLGEPNAPCRTCGAALAADQRYCLQCGTRRAEARLPFLEILARPAPAGAVATPPPRKAHTGFIGRMGTNAAAVAGVACLLLALGVGVLIGGTGSNDGPAGSPQVISVGGAAPAVAPAQSSTATPDTSTTPDATSSSKSDKKSSSAAAKSSKSSKATNKALQNLDSTSGKDYSKKSAKLPKTLGTGGKAPPVDKSGTKIGGGSDVESIG
jgi:hypothetical protein